MAHIASQDYVMVHPAFLQSVDRKVVWVRLRPSAPFFVFPVRNLALDRSREEKNPKEVGENNGQEGEDSVQETGSEEKPDYRCCILAGEAGATIVGTAIR